MSRRCFGYRMILKSVREKRTTVIKHSQPASQLAVEAGEVVWPHCINCDEYDKPGWSSSDGLRLRRMSSRTKQREKRKEPALIHFFKSLFTLWRSTDG